MTTPPKNDKARKDWLASLREGDEVVIMRLSWQRCDLRSAVVGRRWNDRLIQTTAGAMFTRATWKASGEQVWIVPMTDEHRAAINKQQLVSRARSAMSRVVWQHAGEHRASDDQAIACAKILFPDQFGESK